MKKGEKAAIVCCSNGQPREAKARMEKLEKTLEVLGIIPVFSDFIYQKESVSGGTGQERAGALMDFYRDPEIKAIFDISGGDIANEVLPYLDFSVIGASGKQFWGYSDLTTILNAIYAKTGKASVLYQVRNLIGDCAQAQAADFSSTLFEGTKRLFTFSYEFLQGERLDGAVVGGNIRCFLKLAGTGYWPDMNGKILLLESLGGTVPQMITYLNQLKQIGVFEQVRGILLGTFTTMEREKCAPVIGDLVKQYAGEKIPIARTNEIGHGSNSKAIVIGEEILLAK